MERLRDELASEARKWADRLDAALKDVEPKGKDGPRFVANVRAYRRDADHFTATGDLVRAFECVVWAWAWLEIGREVGAVGGAPAP